MNYHNLLFDADDTLFDFHQASLQAFAVMCQKNDIPNTPEVYQVYYDINHVLWAAFDRGEVTKEYLTLERYVRFLATLGLERDAAKCNREYLEGLGNSVFPLPHAEDVCRELHRRGHILYIATNAVAVFSLCNGLSRPLSGVVFDKLKAVKTMAVVAALLTVVSLGLCFVYDNAVTALVIILALVALCYGASTTLGPTFISSVFGQKHYRSNHGVQALSAIPFTILGSQGISAVYDATGSYRGFFIIMAVGGVIALALALWCGPCIRKLQKKYSEVR